MVTKHPVENLDCVIQLEIDQASYLLNHPRKINDSALDFDKKIDQNIASNSLLKISNRIALAVYLLDSNCSLINR